MARKIDLSPVFETAWRGVDPFDAADALQGEEFRKVKNRRTFRFELDGKGYFAKIHHGVGWKEILKNYLRGKRPVLGAENEYLALRLLHRAGVDTMTGVAFGLRGNNPAALDSFLITEELCGMTSLEDYCRDWPGRPPAYHLRLALINRLALAVKGMHDAGLNHRDCYLCHFLLDPAEVDEPEGPRLYVIDLHRAEIRPAVPFRYRVKDVAGIYFSSMDCGVNRKDLLRFLRVYSGKSARRTLAEDARFWSAVDRAAHSLYRKEQRRIERRNRG